MNTANVVDPQAGGAPDRPGDGRQEQSAVWAYAIIDGGADALAAQLSWLTGVGGAPVRAAACSGLTMLVSDVSEAQFGEAALRRNMEDLDWLDQVARAHHHVIDAARQLFPVLPTRLATVYSSDAAVCAALGERRAALRAALHRVGGRVEWGVKGYAVPESETAARRPGASPKPGTARDDDAASRADPSQDEDGAPGTRGGAGLAYLRRRREQLAAGRESRAAAVDAVRAVHDALADRAELARLHPPQSPQLSGVQLPMLLNAAYLIAADRGDDFNAAVAAQASAHPELRIELTGPWPPYSFAADDYDDDRR